MESLFVAIIILILLTCIGFRYARRRVHRKSERDITRWNLIRATEPAYIALAGLAIACGLVAVIALCRKYGRIGRTAEWISDALILAIVVLSVALKTCICVKPIWQGIQTGDFDALRNQKLVYSNGVWHYYDSEWYIGVGTGRTVVIFRKALDLKHSARIREEKLGMSHSYDCCFLPLKNGKIYCAIGSNDEYFFQWLKRYGLKIE